MLKAYIGKLAPYAGITRIRLMGIISAALSGIFFSGAAPRYDFGLHSIWNLRKIKFKKVLIL
jgi:hypothetical protein